MFPMRIFRQMTEPKTTVQRPNKNVNIYKKTSIDKEFYIFAPINN